MFSNYVMDDTYLAVVDVVIAAAAAALLINFSAILAVATNCACVPAPAACRPFAAFVQCVA